MDRQTSQEGEYRAATLRRRASEFPVDSKAPAGPRHPNEVASYDTNRVGAPWLRPKSARRRVRIGVVIPCYNVSRHILALLERIGPEVTDIFVVDDCCPEGTGALVRRMCQDPRVVVVQQERNSGVGAATMRGYQQAIAYGCDVMLKLDGDGQMDPALIARFVRPVATGQADYTKGNRFFHLEHRRGMPAVRQFGNAVLSLMTKLSSGYWDVVDPTNGFTCIHAKVAKELPLQKISSRYFFESDMLFRLGLMGAVVSDVPMASVYGNEVSGLRIRDIVGPFARGHLRNFAKRVVYKYFVREVNVGTLELLAGAALTCFGTSFGGWAWFHSVHEAQLASSGTVMLAGMSIILGTQLLLSSLHFDIQSVPRHALHPKL